MTTVLWIVGGLFGLYVLLMVRVISASLKRDRILDALIAPVLEVARSGDSSSTELVHECAKVPATRCHLYRRLKKMGHGELFPEEFRTTEKVAESNMVTWLMHRNELNAVPAHIELVAEFEVYEPGQEGRVFMFRFRVLEPHWAADRAWMAGVAGPYWDGEESAHGLHTFSELKSYDGDCSESHLDFVRTATQRHGLAVRY